MWTLKADACYDVPAGYFQGHPINAVANANVSVAGKTDFLSPASSYDLQQTAYAITNLSLGFRRADDNLTVTFRGSNILNANFTTGKALGSTHEAATWSLGDPCTCGVSAAVRF